MNTLNSLSKQSGAKQLQDRASFTRKNELIFAAAKIVFEKEKKVPVACMRNQPLTAARLKDL